MKERRFTRRDFIYLSLGGGIFIAGGLPLARAVSQREDGTRAVTPTPSNTLGPFYKAGAPRRESLIEAGTSSTPLLVAGRIINTDGRALADAGVEVFHSDTSGEYDLRGFRYRGEIPVGAGGRYVYETVVPGSYGGRAQHIHYVISAPGHRRLVTQLYFENDPKFGGNPDRNYARDNLVWHRELIRPVETVKRNNATYSSVVFDICLEKA
jgi:protocatechuate 3,4-dioxygenase beta subunit